MENEQQQVLRKEALGNNAIRFIGILCFLFTLLSCAGAVTLDLIGKKAIGKVSNAAVNCPPGKTCWTGKIDFTTDKGEQITFYPMTAPMLFDFDPFLSGRSYEEYGNYQVRYFAPFPKFAKVKLVYFLEYSSQVLGCCFGAFMLLIASAFSTKPGKERKPLVIDLSKFRNK